MRDDHLVGEGRLFEPDVMLPAQYFAVLRKRAPQGPEYMLVIAMLQDAVECLQKYRFSTDEVARELYESAREWIASDDRKWPFSFENVCGVLNLHPEYLRRGLAAWGPVTDDQRRTAKVVPFKMPRQSAGAGEPSVETAKAS